MPGPAPQRRLSWEPLRDYVLREMTIRGQPTTTKYVARALGTNRERLLQYAASGVPIGSADRIATKVLGIHPCLIWPEYFDLPNTKH